MYELYFILTVTLDNKVVKSKPPNLDVYARKEQSTLEC